MLFRKGVGLKLFCYQLETLHKMHLDLKNVLCLFIKSRLLAALGLIQEKQERKQQPELMSYCNKTKTCYLVFVPVNNPRTFNLNLIVIFCLSLIYYKFPFYFFVQRAHLNFKFCVLHLDERKRSHKVFFF